MYAIRVVGPSGYERYWNADGDGFLSDKPSKTFNSKAKAEDALDLMPTYIKRGCYVDVVNLEGE